VIKPGSDPFKELIDRRLNESASPQQDYDARDYE